MSTDQSFSRKQQYLTGQNLEEKKSQIEAPSNSVSNLKNMFEQKIKQQNEQKARQNVKISNPGTKTSNQKLTQLTSPKNNVVGIDHNNLLQKIQSQTDDDNQDMFNNDFEQQDAYKSATGLPPIGRRRVITKKQSQNDDLVLNSKQLETQQRYLNSIRKTVNETSNPPLEEVISSKPYESFQPYASPQRENLPSNRSHNSESRDGRGSEGRGSVHYEHVPIKENLFLKMDKEKRNSVKNDSDAGSEGRGSVHYEHVPLKENAFLKMDQQKRNSVRNDSEGGNRNSGEKRGFNASPYNSGRGSVDGGAIQNINDYQQLTKQRNSATMSDNPYNGTPRSTGQEKKNEVIKDYTQPLFLEQKSQNNKFSARNSVDSVDNEPMNLNFNILSTQQDQSRFNDNLNDNNANVNNKKEDQKVANKIDTHSKIEKQEVNANDDDYSELFSALQKRQEGQEDIEDEEDDGFQNNFMEQQFSRGTQRRGNVVTIKKNTAFPEQENHEEPQKKEEIKKESFIPQFDNSLGQKKEESKPEDFVPQFNNTLGTLSQDQDQKHIQNELPQRERKRQPIKEVFMEEEEQVQQQQPKQETKIENNMKYEKLISPKNDFIPPYHDEQAISKNEQYPQDEAIQQQPQIEQKLPEINQQQSPKKQNEVVSAKGGYQFDHLQNHYVQEVSPVVITKKQEDTVDLMKDMLASHNMGYLVDEQNQHEESMKQEIKKQEIPEIFNASQTIKKGTFKEITIEPEEVQENKPESPKNEPEIDNQFDDSQFAFQQSRNTTRRGVTLLKGNTLDIDQQQPRKRSRLLNNNQQQIQSMGFSNDNYEKSRSVVFIRPDSPDVRRENFPENESSILINQSEQDILNELQETSFLATEHNFNALVQQDHDDLIMMPVKVEVIKDSSKKEEKVAGVSLNVLKAELITGGIHENEYSDNEPDFFSQLGGGNDVKKGQQTQPTNFNTEPIKQTVTTQEVTNNSPDNLIVPEIAETPEKVDPLIDHIDKLTNSEQRRQFLRKQVPRETLKTDNVKKLEALQKFTTERKSVYDQIMYQFVYKDYTQIYELRMKK